MAYNYEYPYVDMRSYNLDWLLARLQQIDARIDKLENDIEGIVAEYVTEQLKPYQAEVAALRGEMESFKSDITQQLMDFEQDTDKKIGDLQRAMDDQLNEFEGRIDAFAQQLENSVAIMKNYTDNAVQANNDYILSHVEQFLGNIQVFNYFTGTYMSVQEMLTFLAMLHLQDALTYDQVAAKDITYDELAAYNLTYTELMTKGYNTISDKA